MAMNISNKYGHFTVVATKKAHWEEYERKLHRWAESGMGWTPQKQAVWVKFACCRLKVLEMQYKDARDGF